MLDLIDDKERLTTVVPAVDQRERWDRHHLVLSFWSLVPMAISSESHSPDLGLKSKKEFLPSYGHYQ